MSVKEYNLENIDYLEIEKKLKNGSLIIYPTDTVYGIAGVITLENSLKKIYEAKERNFSSPLIVLVSDINKVEDIAIIGEENRKKVKELIKNFWPGGLTIILKKKECVPAIITGNGDTVGIRMPNLEVALKIIESAGGILPTTSANISGEATPKSYDELSQKIKQRVDLLINGGKSPIGEASTIIDMSEKPKILRVGAISVEDIEKIIGKI